MLLIVNTPPQLGHIWGQIEGEGVEEHIHIIRSAVLIWDVLANEISNLSTNVRTKFRNDLSKREKDKKVRAHEYHIKHDLCSVYGGWDKFDH